MKGPCNSAPCVHFTLEMIYILLDGIKDLKMPGCCYDSVRPCVELAGILVPTDSSQYDPLLAAFVYIPVLVYDADHVSACVCPGDYSPYLNLVGGNYSSK